MKAQAHSASAVNCLITQYGYCSIANGNHVPRLVRRLQVLFVETAVAGIGPFNRKWKGFEEKGSE